MIFYCFNLRIGHIFQLYEHIKDAPLLLHRADQRSSSLQPTATNCNNERQARHLRGDQLRQVQAEEDRDAGEESPAFKRNHRTGEGGDVVKPPPSRHALYTPPFPPALPCFQSLLLAV